MTNVNTIPAGLIRALRVGLHHTECAADRARTLARVAEMAGMQGNAQHHLDYAAQADNAVRYIRAALDSIQQEI